jgi:bcr-type benzoyl-CoA reductase subunit C
MADVCEQLNVMETVCADPYGPARRVKAEGGRVAGYMCAHTPMELLHAGGYLPVRLLGRTAGTTHLADAHMPAYACGFVRSLLDEALSGDLDFLDLTVFSHTCDTMQNFAGIWRSCLPDTQVLTLTSPATVGSETGVAYYRSELERGRAFLEFQSGRITDEHISASVELYERRRKLMRHLYKMRRANPEVLSARQFMSVVYASFWMRVEEHYALVEGLMETLAYVPPGEPTSKPRVFVVGNTCPNADYFAAIEDAGCVVADDDMCSGGRAFAQTLPRAGEPLERLAWAYSSSTLCPTKHEPGFDAGHALLARVRESGADGVVFLMTKFCEPWGFDYPHLRKTLEDAGVAVLQAEVETHHPPGAQLTTRIEAFVEMMEARR